jgi:hypothetical protein
MALPLHVPERFNAATVLLDRDLHEGRDGLVASRCRGRSTDLAATAAGAMQRALHRGAE